MDEKQGEGEGEGRKEEERIVVIVREGKWVATLHREGCGAVERNKRARWPAGVMMELEEWRGRTEEERQGWKEGRHRCLGARERLPGEKKTGVPKKPWWKKRRKRRVGSEGAGMAGGGGVEGGAGGEGDGGVPG